MDLCFCASVCVTISFCFCSPVRGACRRLIFHGRLLPLRDLARFISVHVQHSTDFLAPSPLIPEHSNCKGEGTEGRYVGICWPPPYQD